MSFYQNKNLSKKAYSKILLWKPSLPLKELKREQEYNKEIIVVEHSDCFYYFCREIYRKIKKQLKTS